MQYNCFESPCADCFINRSDLREEDKRRAAVIVGKALEGKSPDDFQTVESVHAAVGETLRGAYTPEDPRHLYAARSLFHILDGGCPPYATQLIPQVTSQGE
jgi:hypothetical protein